MIEVTRLYCPYSGRQPGEDESTHHLVPRAAGMTCARCGETEKTLREKAERKTQQPFSERSRAALIAYAHLHRLNINDLSALVRTVLENER